MNTAPFTTRPIAASTPHEEPEGQRNPRASRRFLHPLIVVCVAQTVLSLALVWSNTAFGDEADYLWIGRLEWAHWLHATSWPSTYAERSLSGSPFIYPPLGALADKVAGLDGARILSLGFVVGATVLLYFTASRLLSRWGATVAAALFAFSEPAIRLAFATFDPLSVSLTALSAWLAVEAGYRRRGALFIAAAASSLALANVTAYSGILIDPVLFVFAFLVWMPRVGAGKASVRVACLSGGSVVLFGLLMTAFHSWGGLTFTVLHRAFSDHQSVRLVLDDVWTYSGLVICLVAVGVTIAIATESRQRAALLTLLGCGALMVPAAQLHDQTGWSLDKHLAYGVWFAAIPASYACVKLVRWIPGISKRLVIICSGIALAYPAAMSWESAWYVYHSWPNAQSFVTAFRPVVTRSHGLICASGQELLAEYYTSQGQSWTRWTTALTRTPVTLPRSDWVNYYSARLRAGDYGVVALFYATTFSSAPDLPGNVLLSPQAGTTNQELLGLVSDNSGEPGLAALTLAIKKDPDYSLAAMGPYDSTNNNGVYAIWQKKVRT